MFYADMPSNGWRAVPTAEASKRYDIGEASNDSVYLGDIFGDPPEHFYVYEGNFHAQGVVKLGRSAGGADYEPAVHVIDGDLRVDGLLSFVTIEDYTPLFVTGSVYVKRLYTAIDACLFVGGSLTAEEFSINTVEDAGHMVVHGGFSTPKWILGSVRGEIACDGDHTVGRIIAPGAGKLWSQGTYKYFRRFAVIEDATDVLAPDLDGYFDYKVMRDALYEGRPIFR